MQQINRAYIEGGGYLYLCAPFHETSGELQTGVPMIQTAVNVRRFNIQQSRRPVDAAHCCQDSHGHPCGLTVIAGLFAAGPETGIAVEKDIQVSNAINSRNDVSD